MAVSKVVYGDTVLIDLTEDTVTPSTLASGVTAHAADGNQITGTSSSGGTGQSKTVTPSTSAQVVSPDSGYDFLSQVTVAAIPYTETQNAAGGITVTIGAS